MKKIAILGTRGIPNRYGGFEQCAEYLAKGLAGMGHEVTVYNSHNHPYQNKEWEGVKIVHCYDPEDIMGTAGQFIYDFNCMLHARQQSYDIILQLGYTSSSVWGWMYRKGVIVTTNMDGLEWKRSKYSALVRKFLLYAEKLAVRYSDYLIADSLGIRSYLLEKYGKQSDYIPYGAFVFDCPDVSVLAEYNLQPHQYDMLIARLESENSIDIILDGISKTLSKRNFLVIGKHDTKYGQYLKNKYSAFEHIRFIGSMYDINILNNLRYYSNIYFHGHTVGGTNPSLLEAMASRALICAHNNTFNKTILGKDAFYFSNAVEVIQIVDSKVKQDYIYFVDSNIRKISDIYRWDIIIDHYETHFKHILNEEKIPVFTNTVNIK